jgi:hypothetical protein
MIAAGALQIMVHSHHLSSYNALVALCSLDIDQLFSLCVCVMNSFKVKFILFV